MTQKGEMLSTVKENLNRFSKIAQKINEVSQIVTPQKYAKVLVAKTLPYLFCDQYFVCYAVLSVYLLVITGKYPSSKSYIL